VDLRLAITEAAVMEAATATDGAQLARVLGLRRAVALGVGGTVGGGVYVLVGEAARAAGPGALIAFALAFLAALAIALPYAELACRYPLAGGGYAFAHQVLGEGWGFVMGWGYWGAYVFVSGYVTLGFGGYLEAVAGVPRVAAAVALVAACLALNLLGLRVSGAAQAAVVAAAVLGLAAFALWGLPTVAADRFSPFLPDGAHGVLSAALLAFLAFGGFDMVAAAGEEVQRPERTLPRAILLTLGSVLVLYLLVCFVALGVTSPVALGASPAPLADAAAAFGGDGARHLVVLTALLTTAATANAVLVVTSRIAFAMARDGLLPRALAPLHGRTGAPWGALVANALLLAAVALTGSLALSTSAGGFLYVAHFVPPLAGLVLLRRRGTERPAFRTPLPSVVVPAAFVACASLLVAGGATGALGGLGWLAVGLAVRTLARQPRATA
jgi:basic amino acid/polyamine antiporter, APA family